MVARYPHVPFAQNVISCKGVGRYYSQGRVCGTVRIKVLPFLLFIDTPSSAGLQPSEPLCNFAILKIL